MCFAVQKIPMTMIKHTKWALKKGIRKMSSACHDIPIIFLLHSERPEDTHTHTYTHTHAHTHTHNTEGDVSSVHADSFSYQLGCIGLGKSPLVRDQLLSALVLVQHLPYRL